MSAQQYDEIGEAFEGFKSLPLAKHAEDAAAMERMCRNVHRSLAPGAEYWSDFHANPPLQMLRCRA
ncbi:putative deacylase [Kitasatospora sp. MAA19]|uniref:hypothetical protein n=1 Tax=Kitasatospora sp. MAA19 TaxID=3035090 RepID=UPI002476E71B|nr:hypothetical protein [Kitasatospora sp. MAA19]MDH6707606.1 putative deacylase [Kitasatospora sp. MAA19]